MPTAPSLPTETAWCFKDLKLDGSSVLKGGSKSKPIKLVDGDHEISCKVDGIAVGLKACFVKKA
jgi:protein PhnA